jgi:hypothetical protein
MRAMIGSRVSTRIVVGLLGLLAACSSSAGPAAAAAAMGASAVVPVPAVRRRRWRRSGSCRDLGLLSATVDAEAAPTKSAVKRGRAMPTRLAELLLGKNERTHENGRETCTNAGTTSRKS